MNITSPSPLKEQIEIYYFVSRVIGGEPILCVVAISLKCPSWQQGHLVKSFPVNLNIISSAVYFLR